MRLGVELVLTELAELTVGKDERAEGAQTVKGLVTVLLGSVFVDGSVRSSGVGARDLLSLPNEVLEEVALVLGQEQKLGLLNNLAQVTNELLTLCRELL
jgi:hypothetical protein